MSFLSKLAELVPFVPRGCVEPKLIGSGRNQGPGGVKVFKLVQGEVWGQCSTSAHTMYVMIRTS